MRRKWFLYGAAFQAVMFVFFTVFFFHYIFVHKTPFVIWDFLMMVWCAGWFVWNMEKYNGS